MTCAYVHNFDDAQTDVVTRTYLHKKDTYPHTRIKSLYGRRTVLFYQLFTPGLRADLAEPLAKILDFIFLD